MQPSSLEQELRAALTGEVRFDPVTLKIYSVDASIYEIEPIGVAIPKNREELIAAVKIAYRHQVPVIARGAATGIAGGCIGKGLIIDTSKYLTQVLEINYEEEYALCEPGVVQDTLNGLLSPKGYRLGPDTSTGNRATIGGMTANNSAGARSLKYGKMVDHVEAVEIVLANGDCCTLQQLDAAGWQERKQLQTAEGRLSRAGSNQSHVSACDRIAFSRIPRIASGYTLDHLIPQLPNLAKLLVGSEGTLGLVTAIKVKIVKKPRCTGLTILHFHSMIEGMSHLTRLLEFHPIAMEMIDRQIIRMGRLSPSMQNRMDWLQGDPEAVFAVEMEGDTPQQVEEKLAHFEEEMRQSKIGYAWTRLLHQEQMDNVWAVRKSGLGLLLSKRSYSRAIAFVEDVSVAPEKLALFMQKFKDCLKSHNKEAGIYGHVGSGCMHVRPYIDLREPQELQLMQQLMEQVSDLVLEYGGAMSGEHGDGLVRSWLNQKMFGDTLYQAFREVKGAFDPENRMNPGKVVEGPPLLENLRLSPELKRETIPTFLDFSREGGFELSADLCNGNGMCRKKETLMCPSYHATHDERDTTRARAQTLRSLVNGRLPLSALTSDAVMEVLDLCLECKGCKRECPSQVDMAKMKAELLYQHQEAHGYSLRSRLFGSLASINRLFHPIAPLFNWINRSWIGNKIGKKLLKAIGIAPQRELPALAKQRFSSWVKEQPVVEREKQLVLFNDTYMEFNVPEIGQAAYKVLTALGYQVIVPDWRCCGRPLISKGLLRQAKNHAEALVELLLPYARRGLPIIGLEPSCILTLKDDFVGLLGASHPAIDQLVSCCTTFDEFLDTLVKEGQFNLKLREATGQLLLHGHCHQKSLVGTAPTLNVLRALGKLDVKEIPSGCCGMAGSFGYEAEHYQISMAIGELHLFPAVRGSPPETLLVADGISCRSQIAHGTGQRAPHLAEFLRLIS